MQVYLEIVSACSICDKIHDFYTKDFSLVATLIVLVHKVRDYKAEAAKVLAELPENGELRKDYRRFKDWRATIFDS